MITLLSGLQIADKAINIPTRVRVMLLLACTAIASDTDVFTARIHVLLIRQDEIHGRICRVSGIVPRFGVAISRSVIVRDDLVVGRQAVVVGILWRCLVVVRTGLRLLLMTTSQLDALLAGVGAVICTKCGASSTTRALLATRR